MKKLSTRNFVLLALLIAIQIVLGYVNIPMPGGLHIVFNMIPMAIAAIALGPLGGAVIGGAFGLISFLQCFGICGFSGMGAALAGINPFLAFVQRFFPRLIDGLALGFLFRLLRRGLNASVSCAVTGFAAAFLNTALFMTSLVWLFGNTDYMRESMGGLGGRERHRGDGGLHRGDGGRGRGAVPIRLYPRRQMTQGECHR